jgi:hypothetical protein
MKKKIAFPKVLFLFLILVMLTGCSFSLPTPSAVETAMPPTITAGPPQSASATPAAPTQLPTTKPSPIPPTKAPTAVPPTRTATVTLAPTKTPVTGMRGFAIFDNTKSEVRGYDAASNALLFTYKTPGETYLGFGDSQMVGDILFYWSTNDKTIIQVNKSAALKLNFLPKEGFLGFAVSADGKKIAWATENYKSQNPASELWVASIDGKGAKKIASIDAKDNTKWMVLRPYRWLADGRLLFAQSPTGIGGYILFGGYGGFSVYDPANAAKPVTTLADFMSQTFGGMCAREISPDLKKIIVSCGTKEQSQLGIRDVSTGDLINIPMLPEQGAAGSPVYSPSGKWVAYAAAKNEPENEAGKVALVPAAGGEPKVLASFANGFASVAGWIDEDHILLETYQGIYVIKRDGSDLTKLVDGFFIGLFK